MSDLVKYERSGEIILGGRRLPRIVAASGAGAAEAFIDYFTSKIP